jgi:hypothetical protein
MKIALSPKKKIVFLEHELSYEEIEEITNNRFFPLSVIEQIFKLKYYYDNNQTLKERKRQPKYYLILMKNGEWRLTYKYENTVYKSIKLIDDLTKEYTLL